MAFHAITGANGVARVATTLYLPKGRIANQVWISLYRHDGKGWAPLPVPSHPVLHRLLNEPNLMPAVNRNYGRDDPLKMLRLDLTMERIRVDLNARERLNHENQESPINHGALDASYLPLLERYKGSDSPAVKYTAEFESARLTKQPNVDLWIAALSQQSGTPIQKLAVSVLEDYLPTRFRTDGRQSLARTRSTRHGRPAARGCRAASRPCAAATAREHQRRPAMEPVRPGRCPLRFEWLLDAVGAPGKSLGVSLRGIAAHRVRIPGNIWVAGSRFAGSRVPCW